MDRVTREKLIRDLEYQVESLIRAGEYELARKISLKIEKLKQKG